MAENNLGQKFVVDILTKYRDEGLRQAQDAQTKLKDILNQTSAAFGKTQAAGGKYETGLTGIIGQLTKMNKLTPLNIASMFNLERIFLNIAAGAIRATANVAAFGEELYYMNRRLAQPGTGGLFNFAFAASQIGLSPEQGLGAIESMGAAVRTNPGLAGLLSRFLPSYKPSTQVGANETLGLVNQLKGRFGEKGYFVASQLASEFGIGEHEFRQMWTNIEELNAQYKIHGDRLKDFGLNTAQSSKSFAEFSRALNNVTDILEIQATRIGSWLAENIGTPVLKGAAKALQTPASSIAEWFGAAMGSNDSVARAIFGTRSGTPQTLASTNLSSNAKEAAIQRFMSMGLSRNAAIGAATGLQGESGQNINPQSVNVQSGAFGIANWLGQRKRNFATMFGHPIEQSTAEEQWQFLSAELQGKGGDSQTAAAFKLLKNPNIGAAQATNIWENMVERHGDAAYTAKLALQSQNYANSHPSGNGTTQNFDVDHNVTVNVHGNADRAVVMNAGELLGEDRWAEPLRQAARGNNFR